MDAATQAPLHTLLGARRAAIADRWYHAVAHTGFAPFSGREVRARLLALTDRVIATLLADPFASREARAIGGALADLHYLHPAALEGTLTVLGEDLAAAVPPEALPTVQPRLAALLGAAAHGYYAAARAAILAEQEAARAPQLAEQQRIEAALRASEARLRAVVANSPVMLFALDRDGVFTFAEGKGLVMLGLTREQIIGQPVEDLFAAVPTLVRDVRRALTGEDCAAVAALGELVIEARHTPVRDGTGAVIGVIGVAFDITARVRAEERLQMVVDHAPIILFATDRAGVITLSEGWGLAALGHQPGELVGQSAWANAVLVPNLPGALRRALAGEAFTAITTVHGATFEIHYVPLRDPHGALAGVSGVALDITARVAAERAARRLAIHLSPQEVRVLPLLARTDLHTYREIGVVTYMAGETVRGHAKAIARKLGLATGDRAAIVTAVWELGLLEESLAPPPEG